jgi:predicted ester cyclase
MSVEQNKEVVRRFYEKVVNTGETAQIGDLIAPDCVATDGEVRVVSGIEGMTEHVRAVREVYADLHVTIRRQIAEGEWVVSMVTVRGTHRGTWLGIRPTGRPLVFQGVNVDRVVDGRIVEHGGAANMLEPFLEAGALQVVS